MVGIERKIAYIFPGQGAQKSEAVDQFSVQLAVVANSCSLLDYGKESNLFLKALKPECIAGLSVGMWPAIYAAKMIKYPDLLEAIRKRAALMETVGPGKMAAIVGRNWYEAKQIWSEEGVSLAAINCPGQFVISGRETDVDRAAGLAEQTRARVLKVAAAGANHSVLMYSIQPAFRVYMADLKLGNPESLIMLNTSGLPSDSVSLIREELVAHLSRPVQWEQSIRNMLSMGIDTFIEWGSNTLSKFIKRIDIGARTISIMNNQQAKELSL